MACYKDNFTFLYVRVDDVDTSQETQLWTSTACYGNSFTFLYVRVDDVRTSQETRLWASTACYGYNFTLQVSTFFDLNCRPISGYDCPVMSHN
jgi:hypothetical protein